jgi:hypothetical protein
MWPFADGCDDSQMSPNFEACQPQDPNVMGDDAPHFVSIFLHCNEQIHKLEERSKKIQRYFLDII